MVLSSQAGNPLRPAYCAHAATGPPEQNWRVKLQTRDWNLTTAKAYHLCLWVKSTTLLPFLPKVAFSFYQNKRAGQYELIDAVQPRITNTWAKYCYSVYKVPEDGVYFWNLNVGAASSPVTYYVDDVTLTSEPNGDYKNWVASAPDRIEKLRKGDFKLDLRYSDGVTRVPPGDVQGLSVTMRKHDFPFGMAYSPENFALSEADQLSWYKAKAGSLFNALVPENAFKWPDYEPSKGQYAEGKARVDGMMSFAAENEFTYVRMHTVEWFLNDPEFTKHWSRKGGCTNYAKYLKQRIDRDVAALDPRVKSLDVFNEVLDRRLYAETCKLFAGGPNSVMVQAFKWANAANPSLKLCVNDYGLVESERWVNMVELVEWLRSNGAPVHCIGAQSHVGPLDIDPDVMAYRLAKLSTWLDLPVEVTEISFWSEQDTTTWENHMTDEAAQAAAFVAMLRTYFSHPNVTLALLWGFADTNHYIANGGVFRADGSPKPAGAAVERLITETWNSSSALGLPVEPSGDGTFMFRGFYGSYGIATTVGGKQAGGRAVFAGAAGGTQVATVSLDVPPPAGRKRA